MMETKTENCSTCKWWREESDVYGECFITESINGKAYHYDDELHYVKYETLALAMDGEECWAILQTHPTFYCCQWQGKE